MKSSLLILIVLCLVPLLAYADTKPVPVSKGIRQLICDGPCSTNVEVYLPSLLMDRDALDTVGTMIGGHVNKNSFIIIYPTVGVGTDTNAPGLQIEGHF